MLHACIQILVHILGCICQWIWRIWTNKRKKSQNYLNLYLIKKYDFDEYNCQYFLCLLKDLKSKFKFWGTRQLFQKKKKKEKGKKSFFFKFHIL